MKQKLQILLIISFITVIFNSMYSQIIPKDSLYLGQKLPGSVPQKFIPSDLISPGFFAAERIAISQDGKEIYYGEISRTELPRIQYLKYINNKWNGPFTLFNGFSCPTLSSDGKVLFYEDINSNISWYSIRKDNIWSAPTRFWIKSNWQHYLQVTTNGNYYMTSNPVLTINGDICRLKISGSDTTIQNLGLPINSKNNGLDFFISKDESFIIFVIRMNGLGKLFISFKKADGSWTNPKNMGPSINSVGWIYGPYVTNDNKYLFFTRQIQETDIYWIKADNLIDSLKRTNYVPYLKTNIPDQICKAGHSFSFHISATIFIDDDGNKTLLYSATLSTGDPLPSWLNFNPNTHTFSGTPKLSGEFKINVKVTDEANASATCDFNLVVKAQ